MNYENYLLTLDKIIPLYYEDVQQDELMHYFGLDYWFNTVSNNYLTAFEATADPNQPFNKETRKQLSLNT